MTCGWGLARGARDREFFSTRSNPAEDPTLIAYRAMLDVPRELVYELAKLLRAERRARGTRKGTRLLTCFRQRCWCWWGCHRRRIPNRVVFDHVIAALVHGSGYERIATRAAQT